VHESHDFLRPFLKEYRYALVVFDRVGSGQETLSQDELSARIRGRLAASGWGDRAEAIVLDPELEVWVFAASPQVERCIGWPTDGLPLRSWLVERDMWAEGQAKPTDPKAALELALRAIRKPRSSAMYKQLGERVGLHGCTDPAFAEFRNALRKWFPATEAKRPAVVGQ
jgi:hypothetical protein